MSDDDFDIIEKDDATEDLQEDESGGLGLGLNALFGEGDDDISPVTDEVVEDSVVEPETEADIESETIEEAGAIITESIPDLIDAIEEKINAHQPQPETASEAVPEETKQDDTNQNARTTLPVEKLHRGRFQPRNVFDGEALDQLADSLKEYGILQPLLVREDPDEAGSYEIIAGERRWQAAQIAQIHEVPVIILELDELEGFKIALIENLQREDLDPIEEAEGYQTLLDQFEQTHDDLAKTMGKSRPHIGNMLRLLTLPPMVQDRLACGDLSMGHARALVNVPDAENLMKDILKKGLSVRQTEKLAAASKKAPSTPRPRAGSPATVNKDADTTALENDISNALGMRVSIDSSDGKSGKLAVEFKSLDQLDEVLHRLAHFPGSRLKG